MIDSSPLLLNGREVANEVLKNIKVEIDKVKTAGIKRLPGLAVLLIGDDPASQTYVTNKERASNKLGIYSEVYRLKSTVSEKELIEKIKQLNYDKRIDGILLQLPLPKQLNPQKLINEIDPQKDVDGLHPINLGKLMAGQPCLKPCTPLGVIEILKHYSIDITGLQTVIIGRSILVGKPLAMLLLEKNASITVLHSKSKNIDKATKNADLLISAIGKPQIVKRSWIKEGAIVIDVGINKVVEDGANKLTGDVDFNNVKDICKAITPVPGGVGPVTIAMLMLNTLEAYKNNNQNG